MSSVNLSVNFEPPALLSNGALPQWFAIHTYPRHEKRVAGELVHKGIEAYLPILTKRHQWSDRQKLAELPLFPCYTFVRITPSPEARVKVLRTGVELGPAPPAEHEGPIP